MALRQRSGNWHYRFQINGHEYTGDTGLAATKPNRTAAQCVEAEAYKLVKQGKAHELRLQVKPFTEAANMYLDWCKGEYRAHPATAKRIATSFVSLKSFFKGFSVNQVSAGDIEDYKGWRRSADIRDVTLRHDLHALSGFYRYAAKHNWAIGNPVMAVEIPSDADAVRMHVLTESEESTYFAAVEARVNGSHLSPGKGLNGQKVIAARQYGMLRDAARLILLQGVRPDELMRARVEDIEGDHWMIGRGKSMAARRRLKLTATAKLTIEGRLMAAVDGWLFPSPSGGHVTTFQRSHDEVLKDTQLDFVLYDLRHTFATRAAAAGMPVTTLAAILGHNNLRTVMKYVHVRQSDIDAGMKMLESPSGFGPTLSTETTGNAQGSAKSSKAGESKRVH